MNKAIRATQQHFKSSSSRTPDYLAWHRLFKQEFTKFLTTKGASNIVIGKPNHFDMSGFFTLGNTIWYFRIEDVRWSKDLMLLRTTKHYKDYTGGMNQYVSMMTDGDNFIQQFNGVTDRNEIGNLQLTHQVADSSGDAPGFHFGPD